MINKWLFTKQDNASIVIFRIFFGALLTLECWGAILTGWVGETFNVTYSFPFLSFEFTQILLGIPMYIIYVIMGFLGLGIMLGYKYRFSTITFFVLWSLTYFMQKVNYNNHYYLLMLISGAMMFIPAHHYKSIDAKQNPTIVQDYCYSWTTLFFKIQITIVYVYASIAKLYAGWLNNEFLSIRLGYSADWFQTHLQWNRFANLLRNENLQYFMVYTGIFFDLFIVPLLLYKKTRNWALVAMLVFHIFNSITLHIGIFPYFALALAVFFYPVQTIQKLFFPKKIFFPTVYNPFSIPKKYIWIMPIFILYFCVQTALPLRHWFIKGDVLWTEEGHRLSWRMMLRSKTSSSIQVYIQENGNPKELVVLQKYLTQNQINTMSTKPDMMYQFAKFLQNKYENKGKKIHIYLSSTVAVNRGTFQEMIKPNTDFSVVEWNYFGHQSWITTYNFNKK